MKEGGNFLKRNNGRLRSGSESFLNDYNQSAGLPREIQRRMKVKVQNYPTKTHQDEEEVKDEA